MLWFKHDSDASTDGKLKKVILRYGSDGYAIYFHCLELIAGDISESNITFELEHDCEVIADNLKIKSYVAGQSAIDRVQEIMRYLVEMGLFDEANGRISCIKMLKRLDASMTSNAKMRGLISSAKTNHDGIMTPSCQHHDGVMQEEKRKEKKREEKEEEEISPVFPRPLIPCNDGTSRIAKVQQCWNDLGFKPASKISVLQFRQEDRAACLATIQAYSDEDIETALLNYRKVLESPDHDFPCRYQSFSGFMKTGVEKFAKDSDPWTAYRKKSPAEKPGQPVSRPAEKWACPSCGTETKSNGNCPKCGYYPGMSSSPAEHFAWWKDQQSGKEEPAEIPNMMAALLANRAAG